MYLLIFLKCIFSKTRGFAKCHTAADVFALFVCSENSTLPIAAPLFSLFWWNRTILYILSTFCRWLAECVTNGPMYCGGCVGAVEVEASNSSLLYPLRLLSALQLIFWRQSSTVSVIHWKHSPCLLNLVGGVIFVQYKTVQGSHLKQE